MSIKLVRLIIFVLLTLTLAVSAWSLGDRSDNVSSGGDQAASVSLSQPMSGSAQENEEYVSLVDVISASLDRIKNNAIASTTRPDASQKTEPVGTTTTAAPAVSADLADAIVNIFCTQKTDKYSRSISGTGFMISPKGVILTNAHVAQFLLLEGIPEWGETYCEARTGGGTPITYSVELLYISPSWIIANPGIVAGAAPRGTGENDFALLYATTAGSKKNNDFAYIPPSTDPLTTAMHGRTVIIVGYPSEEDDDINNQIRSVATTSITQLYTFDSGLADVFSLAASPLGHQGISGGPVIDNFGRAIGVISTKQAGTTVLNAITTSYIDRSMKAETGFDLATTLQGDLSYRAAMFNATVSPILQELLTEQIR